MNVKNNLPAGATRYSEAAKELLLLLKQGKIPVIASGYAPDNPNGLVIRIWGDDGFAHDYPVNALYELASHAPLFSGTDAGPLDQERPHKLPQFSGPEPEKQNV